MPPNSSEQTTAFYRKNTEISVDFSAEGISFDGAVVLLEKLECQYKVIRRFSRHIPDQRDSSKVDHPVKELFKQRAYTDQPASRTTGHCQKHEYLIGSPKINLSNDH